MHHLLHCIARTYITTNKKLSETCSGFGTQALAAQLANITGFDAVSLQPNSGASGEYAGLMAIRAYHRSRGDSHRNVCIIPVSAHGTNPASAIMAGMRVVPIGVDAKGEIDAAQLKQKAEEHKDKCVVSRT